MCSSGYRWFQRKCVDWLKVIIETMEINNIIEELKKLDLSQYPKDEIKELFNQIGQIGSIVVTYHKGKSVMRARPNFDGERYNNRKDLSFKPQKFNKTYQRASTPHQTMFYGTAIPDKITEGELDNMRVIGVAETIEMLRDKNKSGYQKISFGRWYVHEEINLIAIIHKDTYYKESSFTRELVDAYKNFSKNVPKDIAKRSLETQTYLADEFAKHEIRGDYDYMISALFTEHIVKQGFDGVIYPSVRVGGRGFNIAITPEASEKLRLYVAGECSIYKLKDHVVIGNDAIVELNGIQEEFEIIDIDGHQKECLAKLGLDSLEALIKIQISETDKI